MVTQFDSAILVPGELDSRSCVCPGRVFSTKVCERCADGDAEVVRRWIVAKKLRDPCIDGDHLLLGYFSATEYQVREGKVQ